MNQRPYYYDAGDGNLDHVFSLLVNEVPTITTYTYKRSKYR